MAKEHPRSLVPLSTVIRCFRDSRALRLRVNSIEDIIDVGEDAEGKPQAQGYALPVFPYLQVLELEGQYKYMSKYTPATMATLLASCPKLTELRLMLSMMWDYLYSHKFKDDPEENLSCSLDQYHFTRSVERFKTFNSPMASFRGSIEDCCAISELPALSQRKFSCLNTSLRKVDMKFKAKEMNCFEVQLVKFLVENAVPLQEIHIDDGETIFWDHLHHKVRKWRAGAFEKKKMRDKGMFAVYDLVGK
jgi:hypothetical protein